MKNERERATGRERNKGVRELKKGAETNSKRANEERAESKGAELMAKEKDLRRGPKWI